MQVFKALTIGFLLLIAATVALGFDALSLEKMLLNQESKTVVASCGETTIYLKDFSNIIEDANDGFLVTASNTTLVLKSPSQLLTMSVENGVISDYLALNCLTSRSERKFLLIRTNCSGSQCGDDFHHVVFDAKSLNILNPVEKRKERFCGETCFQRAMKPLMKK